MYSQHTFSTSHMLSLLALRWLIRWDRWFC